ncbi:MAG: hypothetical protein QOC80_269, partial [Frankiaceae bacterium]|nr:hypothetical protein [Frankiaceae bacterium]
LVCIYRRKVMVPKKSHATGGEQPGRPELQE